MKRSFKVFGLIILVGLAFGLGGIYRHACLNAGRTLSVDEFFDGVLVRTSNCGGNSEALSRCRYFALSARTAADENKDVFDLDRLADSEWQDLANLTTNRMADYLIRRSKIDLNQNPKAILIICQTAFGNIPKPNFWNGHKQAPAHAVGYADGHGDLISPAHFRSLNLSDFVSASAYFTNSRTKVSAP